MPVNIELLRRVARLFAGYQRAHGQYTLPKVITPGRKVEGKAVTVAAPAGEQQWRDHIEGTGPGLGVVPLRVNDDCYFAAIDVDVKEFPRIDAKAEAKRIAAKKLPLVVCRSKSGGVHLYAFFKQAEPADLVRKWMHSVAAHLGFGGAEIFPKQENRASEADHGNWINLALYGISSLPPTDLKARPAYDDEGDTIGLEEFIQLAESRLIENLSDMGFADVEEMSEEMFSDGPPCLQRWASRGGFPEGTRNDGFFNVVLYCKRRYPDSWESKVTEINAKMCSPALPAGDIHGMVKSHKRKEYQFKCKQAPLKTLCDKRLCLTRSYGIGETVEGGGVEIASITKYLGDPVIWCIELGGQRIEMLTEELFNHRTFSIRCMDKLNKLPLPVNQVKWLQYLREKLETCDEVPAPEDAGEEGQFQLYLERWLTGATQAKTADELLLGKPWRDGGVIYFLSDSLFRKMDADRFKYRSKHHVWQMIRSAGGEKGKGMMLRDKFRSPWTYPDPSASTTKRSDAPADEQEEF